MAANCCLKGTLGSRYPLANRQFGNALLELCCTVMYVCIILGELLTYGTIATACLSRSRGSLELVLVVEHRMLIASRRNSKRKAMLTSI